MDVPKVVAPNMPRARPSRSPEPPERHDRDNFSYSTDEQSRVRRTLIRTVERIGGQQHLRRLYESRLTARYEHEGFFDTAVRLLRLDVTYDAAALARAPATGPLLVIANHPFGILDGVVLTWLMLKVRPDVKVLTHAALSRVPEACDKLLPVDFSQTESALQTNLNTRKAALEWLNEGHAVGIFPGGGVATSERWSGRRAFDLPWAPFTAKLVCGSAATVLPVHFSGQNSRLFQVASHLSLTLRLSLIMHETARRVGTCLDVAIGEPIPASALAGFRDRRALLDDLRRRTYALGNRGDDEWMRAGRIRMPKPERVARGPVVTEAASP